MAYIVAYIETNTANASTYTVSLGSHAAGDLLLVFLAQDNGGSAFSTSSSGWAIIGTQAAYQASRHVCAYKVAASASETNPVFSGATDDWIGFSITVRDADITTPIEGWMRSDWGNGSTISSASSNTISASSAGGTALITSSDDALLIYSWGSDAASSDAYIRVKLSDATMLSSVCVNGVSQMVSFKQGGISGTPPAVTMYQGVSNEGGNGWVLSIKNATGGALQPQAITVGGDEYNWVGQFGNIHSPLSAPSSPSSIAASINGITCSSIAASFNVAAGNVISSTPLGKAASLLSTESTAGSWVGGVFTVSPKNMSGNIFSVVTKPALDARFGAEGVIVVLGDGTNWAAYQTGKEKYYLIGSERCCFIKCGFSQQYDVSGTLDFSAITKIGIFSHREGSSATVGSLYFQNIFLYDYVYIVGGGENYPASFQNTQPYTQLFSSFDLANIQGASQNQWKSNIQIGDGVTKTYFDAASSAFCYPKRASWLNPSENQSWNVNDEQVGINIKASDNCVIKFEACIISSDTKQFFSIDSSSSLLANSSFVGMSIVGFVPTWKTGVACNGVIFKQCGQIDFKGADIENSVSYDGLDENLCVVTDGFSATNSDFTSSTTCIYGIKIDSPGSITLTACSFTGFTYDINVTATTGTVNVNYFGMDVPTYTSAGATVNIVSLEPQATGQVVDILTGSRMQIYNVTTATEMVNAIVSGTSYSSSYDNGTGYSVGDVVRVRLTYCSGLTAKLPDEYFTVATSSGWTVLAAQQDDDVYILNGIDGSTVTEYGSDYANVQIDLSDGDGYTTIQRGYAWYCDQMMGDDGIRYFYGAFKAEDALNYMLDTDVADIKLQNTGASGVTVTGGALRRKDGSSPIAAGGSIYLYYGRTYAVEAGVSGLTPAEADKLMSLESSTGLTVAQFLALR